MHNKHSLFEGLLQTTPYTTGRFLQSLLLVYFLRHSSHGTFLSMLASLSVGLSHIIQTLVTDDGLFSRLIACVGTYYCACTLVVDHMLLGHQSTLSKSYHIWTQCKIPFPHTKSMTSIGRGSMSHHHQWWWLCMYSSWPLLESLSSSSLSYCPAWYNNCQRLGCNKTLRTFAVMWNSDCIMGTWARSIHLSSREWKYCLAKGETRACHSVDIAHVK